METKKSRNRAQIYKNGKLIAWGERQSNNLYKMLFKTIISEEANTTTQSSLEVWHKRLGHLNTRAIKEIISKNLGTGVNLDSQEDFFCSGCAYSKQHKEPFQKSERQKMKPGELIHSDVAIMPKPSVNGAKYFVTFKDDHSGYRVVYFMKHKNDTLECFKEFHRTIKTKYNRSIQILHTDNGTEYVNSEFKEYLSKHDITAERTAPYSPQQNSRAERDMRTIVESARAMLYNADLPMELWAEAVNTAVYILNRTPTVHRSTELHSFGIMGKENTTSITSKNFWC